MSIASYLDFKNAYRIDGLSPHDPIAIFSFACLCLIVIIAILLLTITARRSAEEVWTNTVLHRGSRDFMPADKRARRSIWSLNSKRSTMLSIDSRQESTMSFHSRAKSRESLLSQADREMAEQSSRESEMLFSPQAVEAGPSWTSQRSDPETPVSTLGPRRVTGLSLTSQPAAASASMSAPLLEQEPLAKPKYPEAPQFRAYQPIDLPAGII